MGNDRVIELGTVLVVGGCGFLGAHVVDQLLNFPSEDNLPKEPSSKVFDATGKPDSRFACPRLRDRFPTYKNTKVAVLDLRTTNNRLPGADYYDADILSTERVLEVFRAVKPDVVIDTVSPPPLEGQKELLYKVNVEGTRNLLEVAGGNKGSWGGKCKAFVYTSSSSVVHDTVGDLINVDEEWPKITGKLQQEYYTETKALAEDIVLNFNHTSPTDMLTVAIRPAGIHGERDTTLTQKLYEHGAKASPFVLSMQLGDNNNLFDFTYVGNIAYAHMLAAELLLATYSRAAAKQSLPLDHERVDGEAFNITNDSPVYFWDMGRAIWALMDRCVEPEQVWALPEGALSVIGGILETVFGLFGKKPRLSRREVRYSCMTRYYSCDKAKLRLGYEPLVPLDEGVARSVGHILEREKGVSAKKAL
ncbi:erg26, C-3 sterol dehydrogenase [Myotisia sp. PD_48]|nr:erg26, C-3 sterol dehydrogenase [Myotisia sp. PD_48]